MNTPSRKYFWFGLVFIFLVGLFGGAFLVLRSTVTSGELAKSTPLSQGKSSDELLGELLKLNQQEKELSNVYVPPEEKNLTEDFLKTIVDKSGGETISPQRISSDDFFISTVLPYLKSNQLTLFPLIPDSVLNIVPDSQINTQKYFKETNAGMVTFFNIVKKAAKIDEEKIEDQEYISDIQNDIAELASAFENLSRAAVPQSKAELHKKVLISVFSLHKFLEVIISSETDPLKSLLVTNETEALGELWQETLYDYVGYPESKRK